MPQTTTSAAASAAPVVVPAGFGDNRGIKFRVTTGNKSWECVLQDRNHYERMKAMRSNSTDSVSSQSTTSSI